MIEVLVAPERGRHWLERTQSGSHDWDAIFHGYRASIDWPAAAFWRKLVERHPDAKVLPSLRDPDRWYDSVMNTIYPVMTQGVELQHSQAMRLYAHVELQCSSLGCS